MGTVTIGPRTPAEPPLSPRKYTVSRVKIAFYLVGSILFVAVGAFTLLRTSQTSDLLVGWLSCGFFGLGAMVFAWLEVRPQVLLLDRDGFTLTGGLMRKPKQVAWGDIEAFFLYKLPRGGEIIAFNYVAGRRPKTRMTRISHALGADGGLPRGWPLSSRIMIEQLNEYRRRALAVSSSAIE